MTPPRLGPILPLFTYPPGRLHFSRFKVLSPLRNTCFRDEPHGCRRLYFETEDGITYRDR